MMEVSHLVVCGNVASVAYCPGARLSGGETEHTSTPCPYDRCEAKLRGEKAPTQIQARHQFWTSRKIGYGVQLHCWCGVSIPVDYSRGYVRQTNAVVTFADEHAECQPKEEEQAS